MYSFSATFLLSVAAATVFMLQLTAGATQNQIAVSATRTVHNSTNATFTNQRNVGTNFPPVVFPYNGCNIKDSGIHCVGGRYATCLASPFDCQSLSRFELVNGRVQLTIAGPRESTYFKAAAFYVKSGYIDVDNLEAIVFRTNYISLYDRPAPSLEMYSYYIDSNGLAYKESNITGQITKSILGYTQFLIEVDLGTTFRDNLGISHDLINKRYYLTHISARSDDFHIYNAVDYANKLIEPVALGKSGIRISGTFGTILLSVATVMLTYADLNTV